MDYLYRKVIPEEEYFEIMSKHIIDAEKYIIFGAGKDGIRFLNFLVKYDLKVDYFVDSNCEKKTELNGLLVRSPEVLYDEKNAVVFIAARDYEEEILEKINNMSLDKSIGIDCISELFFWVYQDIGDDILEKAYKNKIIR